MYKYLCIDYFNLLKDQFSNNMSIHKTCVNIKNIKVVVELMDENNVINFALCILGPRGHCDNIHVHHA